MWEGASPWLFAALYYPTLQVLPLYLFARGPRNETIYRRMTTIAVSVAAGGWLPTARRLAVASAGGKAPASLASALGLRTPGLAAALTLPLLLTMLLFAGPLLALALSRPRGAAARHAGHGSSLWAQRITHLPLAQALRNWVTAPLLEEFLFRGCLLSYLLVAGASPGRCVALSPALFAACHLHHLNDLVRFQGVALTTALRQVGSQFLYTWLFGSLAAFYFVRSRHLVAAVLPHAFCNLVGPPVVPARHQRAVAGTMLVGAVAFFCLLRPLTEPRLFANGHSM